MYTHMHVPAHTYRAEQQLIYFKVIFSQSDDRINQAKEREWKTKLSEETYMHVYSYA
jgi:hypothetical protein